MVTVMLLNQKHWWPNLYVGGIFDMVMPDAVKGYSRITCIGEKKLG